MRKIKKIKTGPVSCEEHNQKRYSYFYARLRRALLSFVTRSIYSSSAHSPAAGHKPILKGEKWPVTSEWVDEEYILLITKKKKMRAVGAHERNQTCPPRCKKYELRLNVTKIVLCTYYVYCSLTVGVCKQECVRQVWHRA